MRLGRPVRARDSLMCSIELRGREETVSAALLMPHQAKLGQIEAERSVEHEIATLGGRPIPLNRLRCMYRT